MPEHKHTKGPWRVDSTFTRHAIKSTSHDIALVALSPQHEANAKLISAAPDLLQAVIEVTASLEWNAHGRCRGINDGPIMPSAMAVELARAAIAKALGQA